MKEAEDGEPAMKKGRERLCEKEGEGEEGAKERREEESFLGLRMGRGGEIRREKKGDRPA